LFSKCVVSIEIKFHVFIEHKLSFPGCDFSSEPMEIADQVSLLIAQAQSHENLCQCYIGW